MDHRRRIGAVAGAHDLGSGLLRPGLELLGGRGAEGVSRHQQGGASLAGEAPGELAGQGGLADAVDAHQQRHPRLLGAGLEAGAPPPQQLDRRPLERFPQVEIGLAPHALLRQLDQALGGGGSDVGGEQGLLQLEPGLGAHRPANAHQRTEVPLQPLAGASQPGPKPVPHPERRH
jgi:hypothetical protein